MIRVDGGNGFPAAPPCRPSIPTSRTALPGPQDQERVPNKFRKPDREDAKRHLHDTMNAPNPAASRFADRWRAPYPKAVRYPRDDPDDLPARFRYPAPDERKQAWPTNAIERRFREVRRRIRPLGACAVER